jgi:hypothetical protein
MDLSDLRARLQDITWSDDIDGHPSAIEALKSEFPHTIQLVELTNQEFPSNCYECALGLIPELTHWASGFDLPELYAGPKFISWLVHYLTEIPIADAANGDLILYFEGQLPTHAGLIKEPRVISKWGRGHIYQHSLLEIPSSYGNEIRFYRKLPASVATMRFVEYARSHPDYDAIQEMFEEKLGSLQFK